MATLTDKQFFALQSLAVHHPGLVKTVADQDAMLSVATERQTLIALLAAADKVIACTDHPESCNSWVSSGTCSCGLADAELAYQALKEKPDAN